MTTKISVITLAVQDLERATFFYESGLGFSRVAVESNEIAFFDAGGVQLALYPRRALAKDAQVAESGSGFAGITLAQNYHSSNEVVSVIEKALSAGGRLVKTPQPAFWGGFSGYFADLDGHLWEIACGTAEYAEERKLVERASARSS